MNAEDVYPASSVTLREVGLRDGLQLVKTYPGTDAKRAWITAEHGAGVRHFEVGSFLPANRYPQFADVEQVVSHIAGLDGAHGAALILNERGLDAALASGVGEIGCVVSATEEHSQRNTRRSIDEAISLVESACDKREEADNRPLVSAGIAMAFGCSIAGPVELDDVLKLVGQCFDAGADVVSLADTVGFAGPDDVALLVRCTRAIAGSRPIGIHLHDTRGLGLANASAALDEGARIVDASLGGLGGCPFAPGATGNIVFEDLAFLCEKKGFATGIDVEKLALARAIAVEAMPGEQFYGAMAKAGMPVYELQSA